MIIPGFPMPLAMRGVVIEEVQSLPAMTGGAIPAGHVASASSINSGNQAAWHAFSQLAEDLWLTQASTPANQWVQRKVPSAITVYRYRIRSVNNSNGSARSPNTFDLEGSNDGTNFTTLDQRSGQVFLQHEIKEFDVSSPGSYLYYRLFIYSNNGGDRQAINEIELLQAIGA